MQNFIEKMKIDMNSKAEESKMLELSFYVNFSCTSPSPEDQVDDLSRTLHTEAIRVSQGIFA